MDPELIAEELRRRSAGQTQAIANAPGINMGQQLAAQMAPLPTRQVQPDMPTIEGRPDINALYKQLESIQGAPLDYSKIEAVNRARQASSGRDFLGGLALQMLGGKTLSEPGGQVLRQALEEGKPLRPNLSDVGYVDPETGEFVENPMTARQQKEKTITGRIDALVKEQDKQAAHAERQAQIDTRIQADQRRLEDRRIQMGILQSGQNLTAELARERIAAGREKAAEKLEPHQKPLTVQLKDVAVPAEAARQSAMLRDTWKDEYASTTKKGGELSDAIVRNAGLLATDEMKEQEAWWRHREKYQIAPERRAMAGLSLTQSEQANQEKANVTRGMDPKDIRRNVAIQARIDQVVADRTERMANARTRQDQISIINEGFPKDLKDMIAEAESPKKALPKATNAAQGRTARGGKRIED